MSDPSESEASPTPPDKGAGGSRRPSACSVPFAEADLERVNKQFLERGINLPGGRSVLVGTVIDGDELHVSICRPDRKGRRSELNFGLTRQAAVALWWLLGRALDGDEPEEVPPQSAHAARTTNKYYHAKR